MLTKLKNKNQSVDLGNEVTGYRNAKGDYATFSVFNVTDVKISKWKIQTLDSEVTGKRIYKVKTIRIKSENGETAEVNLFSPDL
jgi:hypothetical protein